MAATRGLDRSTKDAAGPNNAFQASDRSFSCPAGQAVVACTMLVHDQALEFDLSMSSGTSPSQPAATMLVFSIIHPPAEMSVLLVARPKWSFGSSLCYIYYS